MVGAREFKEKANQALLAFGEILQSQPVVMPQMVTTYSFSIDKPRQVVIVGRRQDESTQAMLREVYSRFLPGKVFLLVDRENGGDALSRLNEFYGSLSMIDEKPTAYVCQDYVCQLPTTDIETVRKLLNTALQE